jgi:hypothetical protein
VKDLAGNVDYVQNLKVSKVQCILRFSNTQNIKKNVSFLLDANIQGQQVLDQNRGRAKANL